ncbi:MAG: outer membrane lipoprotein-sorting protein [Gammaproteobacteria bacterium]|nr:MAG: outer membrane lipoprotein-sorting protein [Gammaproteobacteria bacterium]
MRALGISALGILLGALMAVLPAPAAQAAPEGGQPPAAQQGARKGISARDVVRRCDFKYAGEDQRSELTIILRDKDGNEKKNVYRRMWKDYKGKDGVAEKMLLVTTYPPDARGTGFMRWAYTAASDKSADQWIYLPVLKKIRRVSIRDPGDSFLGSDLTYYDISAHDLDEFDYRLVGARRKGPLQILIVEARPKDRRKALYSRIVSWYGLVRGDWRNCSKFRVDYYDRKGEPLKQQLIKWQRVKGAWIWDEVAVRNVQTAHSSIFRMRKVEVNVGLKDGLFTERTLRLGLR